MKFPRVGVTHLIKRIEDLYLDEIYSAESITLTTSSQPNSAPHVGTLLTFSYVFNIANYFKKKYAKKVNIVIDLLDNAPSQRKVINGVEYQYMLKQSNNGFNIFEVNREIYNNCLRVLSSFSAVDYKIRDYSDFCLNSNFYYALNKMLVENIYFNKITNPGGRSVHIRAPCPECGIIEKDPSSSPVVLNEDKEVKLSAICPIHGTHETIVKSSKPVFLDTGTAPRDIAKQYTLAKNSIDNGTLEIMIDGSDWAGNWFHDVILPGYCKLGISTKYIPKKIYTPVVITDNGLKLSKSIYMNKGYGSDIPPFLLDITKLDDLGMESYLWTLYMLTAQWVEMPERLFHALPINEIVSKL
ncbi:MULTISPECIES: hypothetical protein [Photorhabdus]|uniref:Lysine--tRNA ligase n=1 Tax=Photorhabdus bodei TaxID=2029681 RepID=A0AAW6BPB1_9GAMM|nr:MULTISPECIES: hypothetical protein [Photorhabdus]MCT8351792.1 hypothetical protein [Photorhabdus kayaii]MDB6373467.1 hypothetical protein [Photorhabdus bodei]